MGFYDSKGYWRDIGDGFYDAKGNWVSPGGVFYDSKGYRRSPGEGFYDSKGNWVPPGAGFYDGKGYFCTYENLCVEHSETNGIILFLLAVPFMIACYFLIKIVGWISTHLYIFSGDCSSSFLNNYITSTFLYLLSYFMKYNAIANPVGFTLYNFERF